MTKPWLEDVMVDDLRRFAPKDWVQHLDDAYAQQLPTRGSVRSPNGLVHEIIGEHTLCDIKWAAYSRKEQRVLKVMGWEPCEDAVTCLECVVES